VVQISDAKLAKWLEAGAGMSDTVASLMRRRKRDAAAAPSASQP
jgi:ribosomal protein S16